MTEKEQWLKERLKASPPLSEDERWLIDLLADRLVHENDLSGAIDTLEMLLSLDALPALLNVLKDTMRPLQIRQQAARAVHKIGADYVNTKLIELKTSDLPELRKLAAIALGQSENEPTSQP